MKSMTRIWLRMRAQRSTCSGDCAALRRSNSHDRPLMLVLFFGRSNSPPAIAIDRKVTLMARTLSDLTSQNIRSPTPNDQHLQRQPGVMTPYSSTPVNSRSPSSMSDPTSKKPGAMEQGIVAARGGSTVAIPAAAGRSRHLSIFSEVSYTYVPSIGFVMTKSGSQ